MEYVYTALILNEAGEEINEDNVTGVLEAAGVDVEQSRVKALVAALEDVDIEEAIETAAAPAAGAAAGGAGAVEAADAAGEEADAAEEEADAAEEEADAAEEEADAEAEAEDEDEDDEASGEGLGELFG